MIRKNIKIISEFIYYNLYNLFIEVFDIVLEYFHDQHEFDSKNIRQRCKYRNERL